MLQLLESGDRLSASGGTPAANMAQIFAEKRQQFWRMSAAKSLLARRFSAKIYATFSNGLPPGRGLGVGIWLWQAAIFWRRIEPGKDGEERPPQPRTQVTENALSRPHLGYSEEPQMVLVFFLFVVCKTSCCLTFLIKSALKSRACGKKILWADTSPLHPKIDRQSVC